MARPIEHRVEFGHAAQRVHAALTDERCLRERLSEIGGKESELVSHTVDAGTSKAVMRQSIDAEDLPGVVRRGTPEGVTIQRTETWAAASDGQYRGTVEASVKGMPGSLTATTTLADTPGGSELVLKGEVKVGIPLVGGKIEAAIGDQLGRLLRAEAKFTNRWLESHQA